MFQILHPRHWCLHQQCCVTMWHVTDLQDMSFMPLSHVSRVLPLGVLHLAFSVAVRISKLTIFFSLPINKSKGIHTKHTATLGPHYWWAVSCSCNSALDRIR
jgi:hypothetical protein